MGIPDDRHTLFATSIYRRLNGGQTLAYPLFTLNSGLIILYGRLVIRRHWRLIHGDTNAYRRCRLARR